MVRGGTSWPTRNRLNAAFSGACVRSRGPDGLRGDPQAVPSPWMALGSRNGVDRGYRRAGEPPPRNRLETPWPMWPARALRRHAGGLHSVSLQILPALDCLKQPLTVGHVTLAWRVHSTRRSLASVVDLGPTSCYAAGGLPMQEDVEERTMNVQAPVVFDEAELPELVHEPTDPRPRGADHLRQDFLTDFRNNRLGLPSLAKAGQQQEHPRQSLLARVEQLIHQVFLEAHIAGQQVRHEALGEQRPLVEQPDHDLPLDSHH